MRGQGGVWAGGGSDPRAPHFRVGSAALVTPTPGTPRIRKISGTDISLICAGYKPDQFSIRRRSISRPTQIHRISELHP